MGLFALGGLLGKFTIYDVWREAESGATSISLSMKGVGISVFLLLLGTLMALTGQSLSRPPFQDPATRKLRPLGWLVTLVLTAAGFGFYFWFEGKLAELGYKS